MLPGGLAGVARLLSRALPPPRWWGPGVAAGPRPQQIEVSVGSEEMFSFTFKMICLSIQILKYTETVLI